MQAERYEQLAKEEYNYWRSRYKRRYKCGPWRWYVLKLQCEKPRVIRR